MAKVGFDWDTAKDIKAKIREELEEFLSAGQEHTQEELGDLLFTIAQYSRKIGFEPEESLRKANKKFHSRFKEMEKLCEKSLSELSPDELESLWSKAKAKS